MFDRKKVLGCILGLILIACAIWARILYVGTDLWYDEACSWFTAKQSFPFGIMDNLLHRDLQHTPLYFFVLHFWIKMFGNSEIAMKSLSVIFGILTVPLVYITSKKIFDKFISISAAIIASISPLLIYFAAEVRMYPIVVFLVLLSLNYLIDFEQKRDNKSLIKLVIVNLLIPYTLVGGIFYNISLAICYGKYLCKEHKDVLKKYLKSVISEFILLIPYFILIGYYAKMRWLFVLKHEGALNFVHIVDLIRNFFAIELVKNIYWPSNDPYTMNFIFTLLVVVPVVYFLYGLISGYKKSDKFIKVIYNLFILSFVFSIISALLQINVFTVRYILYLLPPFIILSVAGLYKNLNKKHFIGFIAFFTIGSIYSNYQYYKIEKPLKTMAFKTVKIESDRLGLTPDDIIIMPFGSDAPYYFRKLSDPRVLDFDLHKELRNPYNDKFYDKDQQKLMDKKDKYSLIFDRIFDDNSFSKTHLEYFINNINRTVDSGHYVLIALYGSDANAIVTVDNMRKSIKSPADVKNNITIILLQKYLLDIRVMLDVDFNFLGTYTKDNYTFLLFQKK